MSLKLNNPTDYPTLRTLPASMMPHRFSITHSDRRQQSGYLTWLDLYPTTDDVPLRRPNTRLAGRVDKIKETLEFIKWKIDTRGQLVGLAENNGAYCTTCSLVPATSYCCVTCPLLRGRPESWLRRDTAWIYFAKKDVELYDKLNWDISTFGPEADKQSVIKWEVTCTDLLQRTEDSQQRYSVPLSMLPVRGFNRVWTFEGRWGKGPGIQAELAPDEAEPPVPDGIESSALHKVVAPAQDEAQGTEKHDEPDSITASDLCLPSTFAEWMGLDGRRLR